MARLGRADIAERRHLAEVGNHLVVSCPGTKLVVKGLVKRTDFCFGQWSHDSSSEMENSDSADTREQQHELT